MTNYIYEMLTSKSAAEKKTDDEAPRAGKKTSLSVQKKETYPTN